MIRDEFLGAAGASGGGGASSNYIFSGGGVTIKQFFWTPSGFSATSPNSTTVSGLALNSINDIAVHPTQQFMAVATNAAYPTAAYVQVYPWTNSGFGAQVSPPALDFIEGAAYGVEFSPSGGAVAIQYNNTSGFAGTGPSSLVAYAWSSSGYGLKYTDPSSPPQCGNTGGIGGNGITGVTFSKDGAYVAATTDQSPYIYVYDWSDSTGFGTRKANPSILPAGQGGRCSFNNAGTAIAVPHYGSPFLSVYPWSSSGFGAKYANPASIPTGSAFSFGRNAVFAPNDTHIISTYVVTSATKLYTHQWSASGFGAAITSPTYTNTPPDVDFSGDGAFVSLSTVSGDTYMAVYPWSASGYGTRVANPAYSTGSGFVRFR